MKSLNPKLIKSLIKEDLWNKEYLTVSPYQIKNKETSLYIEVIVLQYKKEVLHHYKMVIKI